MVSVIVGIAVIMIGMAPAMALPIPELDGQPKDLICDKLVAAQKKSGGKIPGRIMVEFCD